MVWSRFKKTNVPYDMFELKRSAEDARRFAKCANIYHKGQDMAWDGREVLGELLEKHGGVHIPDETKEALKRIFAIILWGEMAAWKISLQLADGLTDLEAKLAATSQAHDEARHFYVMHDYLTALGYQPERMDFAPEALLDLVLDTPNLSYKLLGMQLMIETMALTIFQSVREREVEPVLTELLKYYERDEARHVGLGMQHLPHLMRGMSRREIGALLVFQIRLIFWALWETKVVEDDFRTLGIDPRKIVELGRSKQLLAVHEAFKVLGVDVEKDRFLVQSLLNASNEFLFPPEGNKGRRFAQFRSAWTAFRKRHKIDADALSVHASHVIHARGKVFQGEAFLD